MALKNTSFLRISTDKDTAQNLGESPQATLRITPQIQLLPFDPQPYLQITTEMTPLSVSNDYTVFIVRCDNDFEVEVTDHVQISAYGSQLRIRIAHLLYDFDTSPVYFRIDRGSTGSIQNNYYSNKFLLTRHNEHLTSRIDYYSKSVPALTIGLGSQPFLSIRMQFYFSNTIDATEVETYYQISTGQTVNPRISVKEYSQWRTQLFNSWAMSRLAQALYDGRCYINQTRNYPTEGLEISEREGASNISEQIFVTDPDENDTIKIIEVIIGPDFETIPFLSSSDQLSSSDFLISQELITIPL